MSSWAYVVNCKKDTEIHDISSALHLEMTLENWRQHVELLFIKGSLCECLDVSHRQELHTGRRVIGK